MLNTEHSAMASFLKGNLSISLPSLVVEQLPHSAWWRFLLHLVLPFPILVPSAGWFALRKVFFSESISLSPLEDNARICTIPANCIIHSNLKTLFLIRCCCLVSCEPELQQGLNSQSLCRLQPALNQTQSSDFRHVEQWAKAWGFGMDCLLPAEILKKARWNKTLHSCDCSHLEWIMNMCLKLCVQGGTPEIHGDVLTPSCNHKVNRACTECMRQPSISSVWVAPNPRCQLQWVYSTWYILERESLVYAGDQLALTGGSWPENHEEGFWDTLVKWMGEVRMGKNKWIWITHILDSLKAGLRDREGTGPAWPFVPSVFHSSNWKWNCEMWNRSKGQFSAPPPSLCALEKWFRLIQADILKTFLWFGSQAWMLATHTALAPWVRMLPGDWLTAAPVSPAKKTSGRPL